VHADEAVLISKADIVPCCHAVNEEDFLQSIMVRDLQIWEGAPAFPDHAISLIR
jgi:hypothetical protein